MCETLIKAGDFHWIDDLNPGQYNQLRQAQKDKYVRRFRWGDIITIKPDGWLWGLKETLPLFVKVKIPGLSVEALEQYLVKSLGTPDVEFNSETLRERRYQFNTSVVQSIIESGDDFLVIVAQAGFEALLTDHG